MVPTRFRIDSASLVTRERSGPILRVLICIEALGIGGKERQAVELVKGLARKPGMDCVVVCLETDDFYLNELRTANVPVTFLPRRMRWDPTIFQQLHRIIATFQPDLVHTNGLMSSFYALPLARLRRIPLINGSIRNAFSRTGFRWTLERLLLRASDYRVANSYAGLRSRGFAETDAKNAVIYNGFDFTRLDRPISIAERDREVRDRQRPLKTVGMVAEFNRFKDQATFIQMARTMSRRRNDVVFVLIGDGPTMHECQSAARGVDAIRFLGKRRDIENIVDTFDIGVLCTFVEGLSNSIMEYMAVGCPVVATHGGGTEELVVDGQTGFLVSPSDPEALAARIGYLLDNPAIARRIGEAGQARLRSDFSITRMVDETIRLYRRALGDAGPIRAGNDLHQDSTTS